MGDGIVAFALVLSSSASASAALAVYTFTLSSHMFVWVDGLVVFMFGLASGTWHG